MALSRHLDEHYAALGDVRRLCGGSASRGLVESYLREAREVLDAAVVTSNNGMSPVLAQLNGALALAIAAMLRERAAVVPSIRLSSRLYSVAGAVVEEAKRWRA